MVREITPFNDHPWSVGRVVSNDDNTSQGTQPFNSGLTNAPTALEGINGDSIN